MSRRQKKNPQVNGADRLPPHSVEMEQGVLGCILLSPNDCMAQCLERFRGQPVFYDSRHDVIYNALMRMFSLGNAIDVVTVQQYLKDNGELDQIGGIPYLNALQDSVPSAANVSYYADIVLEKYQLRRIVQTCSHVNGRVYEFKGEVDVLLDEVERDFSQVINSRPVASAPRSTVDALRAVNLNDFSQCLIGSDWLERGSSCLISAASGIGKSVLQIQMAAFFALGHPFIGLKPHRPLKSVIIYAENSHRDNARALQGVVGQMKLDNEFDGDNFKLLNQNVIFRECYSESGPNFVRLARKIATEEKPDLMWLDPAAAYVGDEIGKQTVIAQFFRGGLHPIAKDFGFAWIIINHFTKPPGNENSRKGWKSSDHQYRGAGSYDLTGWSRAGITIEEHANGVFQMRFAKRAKLAGATHPDGTPTTTVWLRHSDSGVFWEQLPPPEEDAPSESKGGRKSDKERIATMNLHSFCAGCVESGESRNAIAKRLEQWLAKEGEDISEATSRRIIPLLVLNKKLKKGDDSLYRKGSNA